METRAENTLKLIYGQSGIFGTRMSLPSRTYLFLLCLALGLPAGVRAQELAADSLATLLLGQINARRTAAGVAPLERHPLLDELARSHSANMREYRFFGLIDQNGEDPQQRKDYDYPEIVGSVGMAIAFEYGSRAAPVCQKVMAAWTEKGKHRKNMTDPGHNYIGLGVEPYLDGVYVTVAYGALLAELVTSLPPDTVLVGDSLSLIYRYLSSAPRNMLRVALLYPYPRPGRQAKYVGVANLTPSWYDQYFRIGFRCSYGPGRYSFLIGMGREMTSGGLLLQAVPPPGQ
ncbi:MAG: CAP domain-containing protein [Bacteroidetes bacterium]|jgi:hypothetical protein|nr:CAP domain-containing protein [Bacteroidota bacterium]